MITSIILTILSLILLARFRAIAHRLLLLLRTLDDYTQPHQTFTIPRFDSPKSRIENALYRKALLYLSSIPALEDSEAALLVSSSRMRVLDNHPVVDHFLGCRLTWTSSGDKLCLRLKRHQRSIALRPYLQHIETVADDIVGRRKELRIFTSGRDLEWMSVPFTHPATIDTIAMDMDLKNKLCSDMDGFLKARSYYHRLGRVWRRSYLLHGRPGTGKSSFVAAMAKHLCYDVYTVDLSLASDAVYLRSLLLQTTPRSVILVEDLDRFLGGYAGDKIAAMLNFMDGIFSCCGEERIMVFTMSGGDAKDGSVDLDPAILRPGRVDVHVHFPMCDFSAFKTLASSYLGLKDHKLYPFVEEGFQSGASLSPAEVGEIMITHQRSPSRALKTVISMLQKSSSSSNNCARSRRGGDSGLTSEAVSGELENGGGLGFGKDATMREFKKLYGLIRRSASRKDGTMPVEVAAAAAAASAATAGNR